MLFSSKVLLDDLKTRVLLNVIDHPREVIVIFGLVGCFVAVQELMCVGRFSRSACSIFSVIKFSNMINAVSNHFIGLFKVVSHTVKCATSAVTQNKIVIICNNE